MDRWMNGWMDALIDGWMGWDEWDGWVGARVGGWVDEFLG